MRSEQIMGTSLSPGPATTHQRRSGPLLLVFVGVAAALGFVAAVLSFVAGSPVSGAVAGVSAVSVLVGGWRLQTDVLVPVGRLTEFAEAFAHGDLSASLDDVPGGELRRLAQAMQAAVAQTVVLVRALTSTGNSLSSSARILVESSAAMSSSFTETTGQASAASASAEQVSHNVTMVSTASHELTSSVTEVSRSTHEAVAVADEAVATAEHTSQVMTRLGDSSVEIGNVVKLITSIAAQTNLLALNATIEAARAGEAGRGFAVVAGEVKELAQETSRATDDISQRIQAIQSDTQGAVEAIGRIREVIERIAGYQTTIAGTVEEQSSTAAEMSRSLNEAAVGSAHIASNVTGLAAASQDALAQLSRSSNAAQELLDLTQELQQVAAGFRLPTAQTHRSTVDAAGVVALDIPGVVSVRTEP